MNEVKRSQAYLRKRKMMMVLPLLVIPFLTLAFYALGGGQMTASNGIKQSQEGLNVRLPDAQKREEQLMDKLQFYEKAERDSMKRAEWMRSDPYYKASPFLEDTVPNDLTKIHSSTGSKYNQALNSSPYDHKDEAPEEKIMQKISLLQTEMSKPTITKNDEEVNNKENKSKNSTEFSSQVDRLEQMMLAMNTGGETDPEMKQLEMTLDKVLDIQHPDRVRERLGAKSQQQKGKVFPICSKEFRPFVSLLDTTGKQEKTSAQFYGLDNASNSNEGLSVEAVVHQGQTLVNGAVMKLRLNDEIFIDGKTIPKGSFVFGIVSLNGERLECEIASIRLNNQLFPVKLQIYDLDGLPGIYVPGAITREVAKNSVDNAGQMLEITSLDPSLKAQAANAGLGAVKSLLSKKIKLVKVTVKDGYKVLLKDKNAEQ